MIFNGNAPEVSDYAFDSSRSDLIINIQEGTSGWDVEPWTNLNLNVISDANSKITDISLDKSNISTWVGNESTVKAILTPNISGVSVQWFSANSSVATVDNGVITGVKAGKPQIIAACGWATAVVEVTVREYELEAEKLIIEIEGEETDYVRMNLGESIRVECKVEPEEVKYPIICKVGGDYKDNPSLGTYENGYFTPKVAGAIALKFECGAKNKTCIIYVKDPNVALDYEELDAVIKLADEVDKEKCASEHYWNNFYNFYNIAIQKRNDSGAFQSDIDYIAKELKEWIRSLVISQKKHELGCEFLNHVLVKAELLDRETFNTTQDTLDLFRSAWEYAKATSEEGNIEVMWDMARNLDYCIKLIEVDNDILEHSWLLRLQEEAKMLSSVADENDIRYDELRLAIDISQDIITNEDVTPEEAVEVLDLFYNSLSNVFGYNYINQIKLEKPDVKDEPEVTPTITGEPKPTETDVPKPSETPEETKPVTEAFADVFKDWYAEYVQYVYDRYQRNHRI